MKCPKCGSGPRKDNWNRKGWYWLACDRRYNPSTGMYTPETALCRNIQLKAINADLLEALKIALPSVQWMADATDADPEDIERLAIVEQAIRKVEEQSQ